MSTEVRFMHVCKIACADPQNLLMYTA